MTFRKVTADTVVRRLAPFNAKRVCISIFNRSGQTAYIHTNQIDVVVEGWPLGVDCTMSFLRADGDHPEEELFCQTESGTADLRIQESWE